MIPELLLRLERIYKNVKRFSYVAYHVVEVGFIGSYMLLQLALLLATSYVQSTDAVIAIFILLLLTLFAFNKVFMEMRYQALDEELRQLDRVVMQIHGKAQQLHKLYAEEK
ncbi:MAG: hypothetical protein OXR66_04515 [Candidatus Woesearchaeota archaeon]|nr:hypothetical protein [Candidatus Woesearchaeota archaeon]